VASPFDTHAAKARKLLTPVYTVLADSVAPEGHTDESAAQDSLNAIV